MKILIVDDQRTQSIGLSQMLRQLGYLDILTATSAADAYQQLRLHTLDLEPVPCSIDIILMDVNMPGLNGIEACASIKSNPAWHDIPIIMVTTSEETKDLSDAFNAGAMDYIHKPPVKAELHVRVSSALRLKHETDERKKREHDLDILNGRLENTLRDLANQHMQLALERERSEKLLLNILPSPIAMRLKDGEKVIADQFEEATVLFVDIANFTPFASNMSPNKLVEMLNGIFSLFDSIVEKHGLEKIKTMGDAYMAVGGLPMPMDNHAEAVANAALEMLEKFPELTNGNLHLRIGIHTGPVVAGVIGKNKFIYDLWGDTVNIASRMQSHGQAGSIQVSAKTYEYLKDKFVLNPRGEIEIKGKGAMQTYLLDRQKTIFPLEVNKAIYY
jgi:adenylate cyclase